MNNSVDLSFAPNQIDFPRIDVQINQKGSDLKRFTNIRDNIDVVYDNFKSFSATELKIQDLTQKRGEFEKKYGDNPWIKTAVVVCALTCISLAIFGTICVVNQISSAFALVNSPDAFGYLPEGILTLATVFAGHGVFFMLVTAIFSLSAVFSPKNTVMGFAPNPDLDRISNNELKSILMKKLRLDEAEFNKLKGKISEIVNDQNPTTTDEAKKSAVIAYLRNEVPYFNDCVTGMEEFFSQQNALNRQDVDY